MGYPRRLLGDDEEIVLALRPHWRVLILPVLTLLVVVPLASAGAGAVGSEGWRLWVRWAIVAVAAVLILWRVVLPFLRWRTTDYVLTTRRIIVRSGVLTRQGRDVPLSKINNVSFRSHLVERIFQAGTLVVESASESGGLTIAHVPAVERMQREVYRLHEEDDAWRRGDRDEPL